VNIKMKSTVVISFLCIILYIKLYFSQVCCCMYHVNMEYLCQKVNMLLKSNDSPVFETNEKLVLATLCSSDNLSCIEQTCKECGPYKLDILKSDLVYCSPECKKEREKCEQHTIPVQQYNINARTTRQRRVKQKINFAS